MYIHVPVHDDVHVHVYVVTEALRSTPENWPQVKTLERGRRRERLACYCMFAEWHSNVQVQYTCRCMVKCFCTGNNPSCQWLLNPGTSSEGVCGEHLIDIP